jgi:hypothetical protein
MTLGSTQPLTEMTTRNLPWGKGRPNSWPTTGIALPLNYILSYSEPDESIDPTSSSGSICM